MIAQIDKQHAAMIALAVDPAREAHFGANIILYKGAAGVGAIRMHLALSNRSAIGQ